MHIYAPKTPEQFTAMSTMNNAFNQFSSDNIKLINSLLYKLINARKYSGTGLYVSDSALLGINKFSVYKKLFEVVYILTEIKNFEYLLKKEFISTPLTGEEIDLFCKITHLKEIPIATIEHFCAIYDKSYKTDFCKE